MLEVWITVTEGYLIKGIPCHRIQGSSTSITLLFCHTHLLQESKFTYLKYFYLTLQLRRAPKVAYDLKDMTQKEKGIQREESKQSH